MHPLEFRFSDLVSTAPMQKKVARVEKHFKTAKSWAWGVSWYDGRRHVTNRGTCGLVKALTWSGNITWVVSTITLVTLVPLIFEVWCSLLHT